MERTLWNMGPALTHLHVKQLYCAAQMQFYCHLCACIRAAKPGTALASLRAIAPADPTRVTASKSGPNTHV